jgi:hypothetical protein
VKLDARTLDLKKQETAEGWTKLHNQERHIFYPSLNIIGACIWVMEITYIILGGEHGGKT